MTNPSPTSWTRTTPALVQLLARSGAGRLAEGFAEHGMAGLRPAHSLLLVLLWGAGLRASELAQRIGVSRQAVAQVIATLERGGYVERVPDPGDARARLICLTAQGRAALRVMRSSAVALEQDWAARLGEERLAEFRATLLVLLDPEH